MAEELGPQEELHPAPAPDGTVVNSSQNLAYGAGRRWLTVKQVCEWMQLTEKALRAMVDHRTIPFRKVGNKLRFPEDELDVWSRPKPKGTETQAVLDLQPLVIPPRTRKRRGEGSSLSVRYFSD